MEFRILGPCEVSQDGLSLPLGGVKQRALLAALLLDAGRVVSADRLINDLWGEEAPLQARHNLQELISQLRKTLRTADTDERIITRAPGYSIDVAPGELDLDLFEELASEGRASSSAGDAAAAAAKIAEALALWRGPPLAELGSEGFAQQEIARLEELQMSVLEERIAADLVLGRHTDVVGELRTLVAANPFRERLREQLMIALYRSARQAEALEVYREARVILAEELGLDPSPALQRVEAAILAQDPSLDLPRVGESRPAHRPAAPTREDHATPSRRLVRKTVTIVFSDLGGSLHLGEHLDPEVMRSVTDRYFHEIQTVIERHGGTVERSIGDVIMAVFGIPATHEDDALRAVRAAAEIRDVVDRLNEELERDRGVTISPRTGVHTGYVVTGDPSVGERLVIGDAVSVAARLEQSAEPGEILIGRATHRLVKDAVRAEPIEPLTLKGAGRPVDALRLVAVAPGAPGLIRHLDQPMVGRRLELGALQQAFDLVLQERTCHLFTVFGAAGVGKSRLIEEFASLVEGSARVLKGRCLAYGEGVTFWPIAEVVRAAAAIHDDDSIDVTHQKIASLLARLDDGALVAERIGQMMGLSPADVSPGETFRSVRRLLECLADTRATVVVLEDVHWAEPTLLDLIENIAEWSRDAPIQLICTARPELLDERPGWGGGKPNAGSVLLTSLSQEDANTMIDHRLGKSGLSDEAMSRIGEVAGGNPLFIEEVLSTLIEDGALIEDGGLWIPTGDLRDIAIPPSIQALLTARLDRLDDVERRVVEAAAVVGKEFGRAAVEHLVADVDVEEQLRTLTKKELVRPDRGGREGDQGHRFRHVLICDAAYDGISKQERATLHERVAEWMESTAGERVGEVEEIIGYHLERSYRYREEFWPPDERERALALRASLHLSKAARRATARIDLPTASSLFRRAVSLLLEEDAGYPELLWEYGTALNRDGSNAEAEPVLTEAIRLASFAGDARLETRARLDRWFSRWGANPNGILDQMPREVGSLIPGLEERGDDLGLTKAWQLIASVHFTACRYAAMAAPIERALVHARRAGDRLEEAEAFQYSSDACWLGPMPVDVGIRRCEEILREVKGDRRIEAEVLAPLGGLRAMLGSFDEARGLISRHEEVLRELGLPYWSLRASIALWEVEMLAGNAASAERVVRTAFDAVSPSLEATDRSQLAARLAHALCVQGLDEEAIRYADICREIGAEWVMDQILWRSAMARSLARRGKSEKSLGLAREAVTLSEATDAINLQANALMDLAEVVSMTGEHGGATTALEKALSLFERKGNVVSATRARSLLGGATRPRS